MNKKIEELVRRIERIPTLPVLSQKIMEVVSDENASYRDILALVEKDQALATKLLRVANSAFYGVVSRVSTIDRALVMLGTRKLRSMLLAFSVHDFFSRQENNGFDRSRFWQHAIICSQVATMLARHFRTVESETLFLLGLIHDVGKVILDEYAHEEFLEIVDHVRTNHTTFSEAEKRVIGTTHYQIAAKLLKQWDFPASVILPILYHHAPWRDETKGVTSSLLYLANLLTKMSGFPCLAEEKEVDPGAFARSPEIAFINQNGFDPDHDQIQGLITHIRGVVLTEADSVMRLFG